MTKWIKFESWSGISTSMIVANKFCFYVGKTDRWGIAVAISTYDRSITFEILNIFFGVEVWRTLDLIEGDE
jgi:hypothetical protein